MNSPFAMLTAILFAALTPALRAAKVLFLGNSLTLHGPAPEIGWTGNWGMAASAEEKDYVHLLTADIAKVSGEKPLTMVRNIADFERGYEAFDIAAALKAELEFGADIVVVAIGENVSEPATEDARTKFAAAFARLLAALRQHGEPAVFVRSSFWPNATKDGIMRKASAAAGVTFVDIAALGQDESNAARAERRIEHAGVAGHPGDKGMRAIADAIIAAIQQRAVPWPDRLIGFSTLRTDLPGGRHANARTMRAHVVKADGTGSREVAAELAADADTSTQFAGWSPDGALAIIHRGWKSPENAVWEEENKTFRFAKESCLLDAYFVDPGTGKAENITAVDRVSFHNSGVFFWPKDATKLGFTALIDGNSHPFRMDRDGRNKTDLTKGSQEFSYGFSSSRDGKRIAYHKNYQVYLADADGTNAVQVQTGQPFNFGPAWSPDGQWVLFVSGEHYDCHPHIVRTDGSGLKKLADRGGYRGVIEFLDVPDFHGGSSDTPVWSTDSRRVYYTAKDGENVELFAASLDGTIERLTHSTGSARHYHPQVSPDGAWLAYGSQREGVRQIYVMRLADHAEMRITNLTAGHAAMWPHWQPRAPRTRRVLYNLDGDSCLTMKAGRTGAGPMTVEDLKAIAAELTVPGSHVDTLLVCVNAQVMYYPTKVGTMRGALSTPEERAKWPRHEEQRMANAREFFDAGVDPYAVIIAEAKRWGLEAMLTFRMNDAHGNDFLRTAFWQEHPEYRLGNGALDFAPDAVRDGADGLYLFNFFTAREWPEPTEPPFDVLTQIGDAKLLARPWQQVITGAGAGGYAAFPDICRAANGDLLCVFYSGYGHVSTPNAAWPNGGRIMAVRSRDNGGSWSAPFVVADTVHDDRDPHIAALSDGTVICNGFAAASPQKPLPDNKPLALFLARSRDDGATWGEPATITVPSPEPFACSAPVRELPDKTLILGLYAENAQANRAFGATIRSRDGGATWGDLVTIGEKSGHYLDAETDVLALPDGSLLAALRSSKTDLYFARSSDMGRTWSDVKSAGFPGHCPHFLRHSSGMILLAHRLPGTSMHWSNDDGKSWQGPLQLDTVIGAYPASVELPGAEVLCVYYEEGEGSGIRSVRLRIADGKVTRLDGNW